MSDISRSIEQVNADEGSLACHRFIALEPGPKLLVPGNKTCGPNAIRRAIGECNAGRLRIRRRSVTFVQVANPKAYRQGTRENEARYSPETRLAFMSDYRPA